MGAVFEDDWCRLTQSDLTIKTYYFPTAQNKKIGMKTIRGIYFEEQNLNEQIFRVKSWGMSLSPCWWACDMKRDLHGGGKTYYNVAIDCGEKTYKGFTVRDINSFLSAIRPNVHPDTVISAHLPF